MLPMCLSPDPPIGIARSGKQVNPILLIKKIISYKRANINNDLGIPAIITHIGKRWIKAGRKFIPKEIACQWGDLKNCSLKRAADPLELCN